ncbi:hypothetical protein [Clostridium sp. FP1]|uniref:hypothetical protein n=1 Tax=Clostridium sp. FP1 TaxID=2724076 RepID=UPI0013E9111A|nr:hypothetical protein [Clostridium sp. FP1]MBZ9635344.1 hypothetical protein [Clostridium sp. FP1]
MLMIIISFAVAGCGSKKVDSSNESKSILIPYLVVLTIILLIVRRIYKYIKKS